MPQEPRGRSVAQIESFDTRVGNASPVEICPGARAYQPLERSLEVTLGYEERVAEPVLERPILGRALIPAGQLNATAGRQEPQGVDEVDVLLLLHKGEDIAALTATEAFPGARLGEYVEGRGLFAMEGTKTLHRAAGLL